MWNTFAASTVGYAAQLESPLEILDKQMDKLLRRVANGLGNRFKRDDVTHLKASFGLQGD